MDLLKFSLTMLVCCLSGPLRAGERIMLVKWNPNAIQPTRYEIWQGLTMLAESTGTSAEIRISYDEVQIRIRAVKDGQASEFSEPVKIPSVYQEMLNRVKKEYSEDLHTWTNDVTQLTEGKPLITIVPTASGKLFERLSLAPPTPTP